MTFDQQVIATAVSTVTIISLMVVALHWSGLLDLSHEESWVPKTVGSIVVAALFGSAYAVILIGIWSY